MNTKRRFKSFTKKSGPKNEDKKSTKMRFKLRLSHSQKSNQCSLSSSSTSFSHSIPSIVSQQSDDTLHIESDLDQLPSLHIIHDQQSDTDLHCDLHCDLLRCDRHCDHTIAMMEDLILPDPLHINNHLHSNTSILSIPSNSPKSEDEPAADIADYEQILSSFHQKQPQDQFRSVICSMYIYVCCSLRQSLRFCVQKVHRHCPSF